MKKWLIRGGLGLLGAVSGLFVYGYVKSASLLNRRYVFPVRAPLVPTDPAELVRGEHLIRAIYDCAGCHGTDHGGMTFMNSGALGHLAGGNLTTGRGSIVGGYTDEDWTRAIRHGVGRDGHGLLFMSSDAYAWVSDRDLGASIAYLRSMPPVDREVPPSRPGPVGRFLFLFGALPLPAAQLDHGRIETQSAPAEAPTAEYGHYLAVTSGFASCHGENLAGRSLGPDVRSTNITPAGIGSWTEQDFERALRKGVAPGDRKLSPMMPSERAFSRLNDTEIKALWLWSKTVAPVAVK